MWKNVNKKMRKKKIIIYNVMEKNILLQTGKWCRHDQKEKKIKYRKIKMNLNRM